MALGRMIDVPDAAQNYGEEIVKRSADDIKKLLPMFPDVGQALGFWEAVVMCAAVKLSRGSGAPDADVKLELHALLDWCFDQPWSKPETTYR